MDVGLKKGIQNLWKRDSLVDFTIVVGKQEFKVHKVVLASVSDHLLVTICESLNDQVAIDGLKPDAVERFIELVYTGNWDIYTDNTLDIHECAKYFQVQECSRKMIENGLINGVKSLWNQQLLQDYTIVVDDKEFKVHKAVLASVSSYFQAMICGSLNESETNRVELKGLGADAVSKLLELIYTGSWEVIAENTTDILECAVYFQIPEVIQECRSILIRRLSIANCMTLLTTFSLYSFDKEVRSVKEFVRVERRSVMEKVRPADVSYEGIQLVIECWDRPEWDLFEFVKDWISLESETRKVHANLLMSQIRFCLMTPERLAEIRDMDIFKEPDSTWCTFVDKAEVYQHLPMHIKVVEKTVQNTMRGKATPILINKEQQSRQTTTETIMYTLGTGDNWASCIIPEAPDLRSSHPIAIPVNNFMVICTDRHTKQQWHIFDPCTKTWSEMAGMLTPKINFALVHEAGKLYALGGNIMESFSRLHSITDSVEVYDFKTNTWTTFGKMTVAVANHAACVLDGRIYVSGGRKEHGDYSGTVDLHCLNLETGTWKKKAPMSKKIKDHSMHVMSKYGSKVIFVVNEQINITYYHPIQNRWTLLKPLFTSELSHEYQRCPQTLVLSSDNSLYLLNMQGTTVSDRMRRRKVRAEDRAECGCRRCVEWDPDDEDEDNERLWCVYKGDYDYDDSCDSDESEVFEARLCRRWDFPDYGEYVTETQLTVPLPGDEDDSARHFCGALLNVPAPEYKSVPHTGHVLKYIRTVRIRVQ